MDRPLIALDTETATLRGAPHLIELGAVRVVDGEIADHFETLVRPQVPIDPGASDVHGIQDDMVADAPDPRAALEAFRGWCEGAWLLAHNAPFDAHVLGFECARHGVDPPDGPLLDSLALARRLIPEAPDHALATLSDLLELEGDVRHRALADAVACWKVVEECLERLGGVDAVGSATLLAECRRAVTIADAGPRPPRLGRRLRPLEAAVAQGAEVTLTYGSADEPPARLRVLPSLLFRQRERSYLEAECSRDGVLKTYRLDRIQRVEARQP